MTLPNKRIIETSSYNEEADVTDEEAQEITKAIFSGRLLFFVASPKPEFHTSNHREVDLTHYRDPHSGEPRYAVEAWRGARKWTTDFLTERAARDQVDLDRQMVGL